MNYYRIGIVNEQGYSDILKPAMLGMEYYNGMEVNDIIVVGDENRLFQLESREPICFRDMGLTVSFGNGTRATANVTVTNTAVDAINETNAAETVTAAAVNAARPVEMNYRDGQLFVDGTHYADLLKYICKQFFGWDGQKDDAGRHILQYVGTDIIRQKRPDYWVGFVTSILELFPNEWDYVLIPDCRFPNEIDYLKEAGMDTVNLRVVRKDFKSPLTPEQQAHPSETALDDVEPDYYITNNGSMTDLKRNVIDWLVEYLGSHQMTIDEL